MLAYVILPLCYDFAAKKGFLVGPCILKIGENKEKQALA